MIRSKRDGQTNHQNRHYFYPLFSALVVYGPTFPKPKIANLSTHLSHLTCLLFLLSVFVITHPPHTFAQTENPWPMVAGNPERTSWTPEEIKGSLKVEWFKPIEPYINYKTQVIAANGKVFISTAKGLYAFNAQNGQQLWVYPTKLPLGNSPTYANGALYVGGFDRKLHAIDENTGKLKTNWQFYDAQAGYDTNPVVANQVVYIGNRDGHLYAFDAINGSLKWKFQTGGAIDFSPAYKNGVIYIASNDAYAYALNATDGSLKWKSAKLPVRGFRSYWPVIYRNWLVLSGDDGYRDVDPGTWTHVGNERVDIFGADSGGKTILPHRTPIGPIGTAPGEWAAGTQTIDTSKPSVTSAGNTTPLTTYFEEKPWRRTVYYLNLSDGSEYSFDSDGDGKKEYAPYLYVGTHGGNRYPPVVGGDGVIYQANNIYSDAWITRAVISGWKLGSPVISIPGPNTAVDEPVAYAAGGKTIYWNLCCDRQGGAFDLSSPGTKWGYYNYNYSSKAPGYTDGYYGNDYNGWGLFGTVNGVYGKHGVQNPPIPYRGKVYELKGNSLVAWSLTSSTTVSLPTATSPSGGELPQPVPKNQLSSILEQQIQKIISAGHLQPGMADIGIPDGQLNRKEAGDYLVDYFKNPSDVHQSLIPTLPFLPPALQTQLKTYLQSEFTSFPPYTYVHIGWKDGSPRELYDRKPEIEADRVNFPRRTSRINTRFTGWNYPPHQFYGMWLYAKEMGGAKAIFDAAKPKLSAAPADDYLIELPYVHNAYIAGYRGYLELEKLAGYTSSINNSTQYGEYRRLVELRINSFNKNSPYVLPNPAPSTTTLNYNRELNIARNFMFLTPELAQEMRSRILPQVKEAVAEYERVTPGWFVARYDATGGEGQLHHLYDRHALFLAKALILKEPADTLTNYLDIPAFDRGDLFYIDLLVASLNASSTNPQPTNPPLNYSLDSDSDSDWLDVLLFKRAFGNTTCGNAADFTLNCLVDIFDLNRLISNLF